MLRSMVEGRRCADRVRSIIVGGIDLFVRFASGSQQTVSYWEVRKQTEFVPLFHVIFESREHQSFTRKNGFNES